jgi:hypothetical protein
MTTTEKVLEHAINFLSAAFGESGESYVLLIRGDTSSEVVAAGNMDRGDAVALMHVITNAYEQAMRTPESAGKPLKVSLTDLRKGHLDALAGTGANVVTNFVDDHVLAIVWPGSTEIADRDTARVWTEIVAALEHALGEARSIQVEAIQADRARGRGGLLS